MISQKIELHTLVLGKLEHTKVAVIIKGTYLIVGSSVKLPQLVPVPGVVNFRTVQPL